MFCAAVLFILGVVVVWSTCLGAVGASRGRLFLDQVMDLFVRLTFIDYFACVRYVGTIKNTEK